MALVGSLVASLSANTTDFESGMRRGQESLKRFQSGVQQTSQATNQAATDMTRHSSRIDQAFSSLRTTILATAAAAVSLRAIGQVLTSSVQAAMKMEGLERTLKMVSGSAQASAEAMQFLRSNADRLGQSVTDLADTYVPFMAAAQSANLPIEDARRLYLGLIEAMLAYGKSQQEIADGIRPVTQMLAQQSVQGDELRQELGSRLPIALQVFTKAFLGPEGKISDFTKLMETGKTKGEAFGVGIVNVSRLLSTFSKDAEQAAQGTAGAIARLNTAIADLQRALGKALLPVVTAVTTALKDLLDMQRPGESFFAPFAAAVREAASAVVGLIGYIGVLGKVMSFLHSPLNDPAEIAKRWGDLTNSFMDVVTLQQQILNPPNLTRLNPNLPRRQDNPDLLPPPLKPPGADDKESTGRARMSEAERSLKRQSDMRDHIVAQMQRELDLAGLNERSTKEAELILAGFGQDRVATMMEQYDETVRLNTLRDEALDLERQRKSVVDEQLQQLDAVQLTEREIFAKRLEALQFGAEARQQELARFDLIHKTRTEQEAVTRAAQEYKSTMEGLRQQLEPQKRFASRAEAVADVQKQMAVAGAGEFELAQANVTAQGTLVEEESQRLQESIRRGWDETADFVSQTFEALLFNANTTFKDIAIAFGRMVFSVLMDATNVRSNLGDLLKRGAEAAIGAIGAMFGTGSTAGAVAGAAGAITESTFAPSSGGVFGTGEHSFAFGGPRAGGGMIDPDKFYTVGERGPEILGPGVSGQIYTQQQWQQGQQPLVLNMHITTPDAESFRRSRGDVHAGMLSMMQRAMRDA